MTLTNEAGIRWVRCLRVASEVLSFEVEGVRDDLVDGRGRGVRWGVVGVGGDGVGI